MSEDIRPAEDSVEQPADDRALSHGHDQRRQVAAFLRAQAAEITARWQERAAAEADFAPPIIDETPGEGIELSLQALIEHLEADGPDTHLAAHERWLACWQQAGALRTTTRRHFHALRDMVSEALQKSEEISAAEKPALLRLLQAAVRNVRLETSEVETERWLAEALEARRLYEELFQRSPLAVLVIDPQEERILAANPAAGRLLRHSPEQLCQMRLGELLPELPRCVRELLANNEEQPSERLIERVGATGAIEILECTAAPLVYYGRPAAQVFLRDVTARIRFREELEQRAEELERQLSGRLEELQNLQLFFQNVINALQTRLLVLDENLVVRHANNAYLRQRRLPREQVEGKHIAEIFPASLLEEAGLRQAMLNTLATGDRVRWAGFRQATPDHPERILNISLDPCAGPHGERQLLVTIEDVTERHRHLYERSILQQIVQAMLGMRDLPRLLHAILTGITAGGAAGLGFNRAFLLLVDEEAGELKAEMAVGPESPEQAAQIWSELSDRHTLAEFLAEFDRLPPPEKQPLRHIVARLRFPLSAKSVLPMLAAERNETIHVFDAPNDPRVPRELYEALGVEEFVVAPLVAQEKIIGVAIADNAITRQRIAQTDVQLLTALANHAALAIESARVYAAEQRRANELAEAYQKLEAATERLVRSEALAAIGEVTAIVAHEIRNPLSTIGGFAKMLLRMADNAEIVRRNARIIVEEVAKLEKILGELLDFTKPSRPRCEEVSLRQVVERSLLAVQQRVQERGVEIVVEVPETLPLLRLDCGQMQQVLTNLLLNALDAIEGEGRITVRAWQEGETVHLAVSDSGQGIPQAHLDQIFDTFFTTKPTGTGLGLALARKVIEDHGAKIQVESKEGVGTTFTITFSVEPKLEVAPALEELGQLMERGRGNGQTDNSAY